jgi:hypothetical protein
MTSLSSSTTSSSLVSSSVTASTAHDHDDHVLYAANIATVVTPGSISSIIEQLIPDAAVSTIITRVCCPMHNQSLILRVQFMYVCVCMIGGE